uniref:Solute carrier family 23 member 3 n=1 Tax=Salvator merianae TaxID=96440 RepID=A0A8D0BXC9_SALMN
MNNANRASQSIPPHALAESKLRDWSLGCFLALQHFLVQVSFLCVFHFLFIAALPHEELRATSPWNELLARSLFTCGISTVLQYGLGTRLPLIQAPSFEFLIPAMILVQHLAPIHQAKGNSTEQPDICSGSDCEIPRNWNQLYREVCGAVLISAVVQLALGVSGVCGWITHRCGPMVLAPSLSVIGLSSYRPAALLCSENWGVAILFVLMSVLLSQHLAACRLPTCRWSWAKGVSIKLGGPALHLFSILLPFCGIWLVCGILRPVSIPWNMLHPSTRHLIFTNSTLQSPWLKVPYPGEQGWPVLSIYAVGIGAAMGVTASMNSVGCYLLCSKVLRKPPPPQHSCNRGLCAEGFGSLLSAVMGSVSGTASSMPNTCAGSLIQATSFCSIWISALACILLGLSPRLMGFLTTIPLAIHGGVLCVTYSVAVGTGVSYFQYTNIDSGRNIFIVGFTMFMGLLVPKWFSAAPSFLSTGCVPVDLFFVSLLMVPTFITGFLSFFLENTVSGTLQERGLLNHLSPCKVAAGKNSLQRRRRSSAQRQELPLVPPKHLPSAWYKGFPFCFLCPMGEDKGETVNIYPMEELHCSEREITGLLLKMETVKPESELELETEQKFGITEGNLENHEYGRPVDPLC